MSAPSTEPPPTTPPFPNNNEAGNNTLPNVTTSTTRSGNNPPASFTRFGVTATATVRATQHQLPGRGNLGGPPNNNVPPTNNNTGEAQPTQNLFQMRDRLFLALFFRVSLIYARAFPRTLRRALEFCLLMQSVLLLFILGYIHIVYTRTPTTCLSEYKDSWPKNGVLRESCIEQCWKWG